jgi:hypothetical protein
MKKKPAKKAKLNKYSVLLMYPELHRWGNETYLAHVLAADPELAVEYAQEAAGVENGYDTEEVFEPLACFKGHLQDQRPL